MLQSEFQDAKEELYEVCLDLPIRQENMPVVYALLSSFEDSEQIVHNMLEHRFNEVLNVIKAHDAQRAKTVIAKAINACGLYWDYSGGSLKALHDDRNKVAEGKREDYTKGDEDVLKNFKNQADAFGITPQMSLGVHMEKQMSAVLNYIRTKGESESEPIIKRVGDTMNYLELLWGLFKEEMDEDASSEPLIFESLTIHCEETGDKIAELTDAMSQTAICAKCQKNFDTKVQRERECTAPDFVCPHK